MFEKLLRELERLENTKIAVPIETDENGYFDKECPDEECLFVFKVIAEDWENNSGKSVFCPMCGGESSPENFYTTEQVNNASNQAMEYFESKIFKAMREDAHSFNNRQSKGGFITMSMSVKGRVSQKLIIPIPSQEIFEQKIQCEECNTRFAVIGSAFFCPCCGHNSVELTFNNTINKIESSINNIPEIRAALNEVSKDQSENTCQTLIEKCLLDSVVAFQRYCDIIYSQHKNAKTKVPFNAFQKLDVGGKLWSELFNESYINWLTDDEFKRLVILFQRRHLLQHTDGIVDEKYIEKSGDNKYKAGQKIIVKEKDAIELLCYIKTLTTYIRNKVK